MVRRMRNAVIYFLCSLLVVQLLFPATSEKVSASHSYDAILGLKIVTKPVQSKNNDRPKPFNGRTGANYACLGIKQSGKSTYEVSYCIDYALGAWTNDYLTSDYKNMTDAQKMLLNYTLSYGFKAPVVNLKSMTNDQVNQFFGTQILVWIIREGYFSKDTERKKIEKFLLDTLFPNSKKYYNELFQKVKYMSMVPSYGSETKGGSAKTLSWNSSSGKYEYTIDNTYKNGSNSANNTVTVDKSTLPEGVSVKISGEKITISSTKAITSPKTIRFTKKTGSKGRIVVWRNSVSTRQSMITLDYDENPIEKEFFVTIQTEALSKIIIEKKSTDNVVKGITYNVTSTAYSGTKTYTTDDKGYAYIEKAMPGTYTITEVQNNLEEYLQIQPQKVTVGSNSEKKVTFKNIRKQVNIDITKMYDDNTYKEGSVYEVYKNGTKIHEVVMSKNKGVTDYTFFESKATYTVKEVKAAEGAELDTNTYTLDTSSVKTSKEEKNTIFVKYQGKVIKNDVTINLTLEKNYWDEKDLPGVDTEYKVTNNSSGESFTGKTNENGQVVFKDVAYGVYTVEQSTVKEGYIKDANFEVNISSSQEGAYVYNKYNKLIRGSVDITKTLELTEYEAASNVGTKFGKGIQFVAHPIINGTVISEIAIQSELTDDNGKAFIKNLTYGKWQISEVSETVPVGYEPMEPVQIEIKEDGQVQKLEIENKLIRGTINIVKTLEKTDMDPAEGEKYGVGIQFIAKPIVNGEATDVGAILSEATNAEGKVSFTNIGFGEWEIYEFDKTTPEGYLPMDPVKVAITNEQRQVDLNIINLSMKGKIFITAYDNVNKKPLSGCEIEIYNAKGIKVFNGMTDEVGDISSIVNYGKYTYKVVAVPKGYVLDSTVGEFAITGHNHTVEKEVYLNRIKGILSVIKVSKGEEKRIPGTEYTLYKGDGTKVGVFVTDKNGELTMGPLEYGDYYFVETKAPEGYKEDKNKYSFTITEDGQVINKVLIGEMIALTPTQNNPITMEEHADEVIDLKEEAIALDNVPKTGDNSKMTTFTKNMIAAGSTVVLMIITEVVTRKKRKVRG